VERIKRFIATETTESQLLARDATPTSPVRRMNVRKHEQDQAAQTQRDPEEVAGLVARFEDQPSEKQNARDGEAV
jgi:hypothetical protein